MKRERERAKAQKKESKKKKRTAAAKWFWCSKARKVSVVCVHGCVWMRECVGVCVGESGCGCVWLWWVVIYELEKAEPRAEFCNVAPIQQPFRDLYNNLMELAALQVLLIQRVFERFSVPFYPLAAATKEWWRSISWLQFEYKIFYHL